jgi:hypothetical protein
MAGHDTRLPVRQQAPLAVIKLDEFGEGAPKVGLNPAKLFVHVKDVITGLNRPGKR